MTNLETGHRWPSWQGAIRPSEIYLAAPTDDRPRTRRRRSAARRDRQLGAHSRQSVRSRSFRKPDVRLKDAYGRLGEGFRTPALCRTVVGVLGPAFESLPRRKPRGGRVPFGRARTMEILGSRTARVCRREGWWGAILAAGPATQAYLVASIRGPGAGTSVGGGLATS